LSDPNFVQLTPGSVARGSSPALRGATALALLIAGGLLVKGFVQLFVVHNAGYDLQLLWTATHYYLRGANPFEASFYYYDLRHGLTPANVPAYWPDLGWPIEVNYPPSSTLTQILIYGLPGWMERGYYAVLSLASCGLIAWWAYASRRTTAGAWLLVGVALANLGYSQTLINGNQGVLVMAGLVLAIWLRNERPILAGLCLGIALVKPTIAAPFVLLFLVDRRYLTLAVASIFLVASALLTAALCHTSVATLFAQSLEGSSRYVIGGYALWKVFRASGMSLSLALSLNAAIFFVPLVALLWRTRERRIAFTPSMLALVAVVARIFTYHNSIDNVVMTFLVVALGVRFLETRRPVDAWWLAAVVASLLIPFVYTASGLGHTLLYLLWAAAAIREMARALGHSSPADLAIHPGAATSRLMMG